MAKPIRFLAGSKEATVLGEIGDDMQTAGLSPQVIHPAVAPALSPRNIAADRISFTCKLITNVASKYELHATFAPRPLDGTAGSISRFVASGRRRILETRCLCEQSHRLLPLRTKERQMAFGVVEPTLIMVQRTGRHLYGDVATSRNFEMLFIDGAANPYQDLVLAATIGAGASGVEGRRELGGGGCKGSRCEGERKVLGVVKRLPLSNDEAWRNWGG
ncbi:hypothetical protein PQX77_017767 [Marasmius sp. AFHP31]|nr:hypothetical protein PQX77_017767 [Marasmius sp. AFHP31]